MMRIVTALAGGLLLALAGLAPGCASQNLDEVRPGMMFSDVENIMGLPPRVVYGDGVDTGKTTWIYPKGKVLFESCTVIQVEKAVGEKNIVERVQQQKDGR
jgi:hypothetical protein